MQDYLMIGTVLKPQGIRGEVKIKPYAARVEMFSSWKQVWLENSGSFTAVPPGAAGPALRARSSRRCFRPR